MVDEIYMKAVQMMTAYVCENYACNQPVNKIEDLDKMLSAISRAK